MTKALTVRPKSSGLAKAKKRERIKPDPFLASQMKRLGMEFVAEGAKRKRGETLLEFRRRLFGIPPQTTAPLHNQVIVWRLPDLALSAGGILIPGSEQSPNTKGVLMAAGPVAWDYLRANGITEEGHIVLFSRFAGWEASDNTPEYARHNKILVLKDKDVIGSDDVQEMLRDGKMKVIRDTDGKHKFAIAKPEKKALPRMSEKKRKLLKLARGTTNPHEAEAARKAAEKVD